MCINSYNVVKINEANQIVLSSLSMHAIGMYAVLFTAHSLVKQLQRSADGFSVVADYFGRGVFSSKVREGLQGGVPIPYLLLQCRVHQEAGHRSSCCPLP